MTIDIETRARRAGEAARTEAAAMADRLEVPGSTAPKRSDRHPVGRPLAGALAGAVAVLLVVLLVGQLNAPGVPTIDPAAPDLSEVVSEPVAVDGVLPVPPVGEAIAAYLDDGTPVFVSHPEERDVRVVGALNPHVVGWQGKLVVFCPSSGWFEDLRHGSRFNGWGDYTGGPAPSALPDHASELSADGASVRVTGEVDHRRPRTDSRARQPQRGPNCEADASESSGVIAHHVPATVPAIDGTDIRSDRWVWAEVRLGGGPGDPRACDRDGRCHPDSPRLVTVPGGDNPVPSGGANVGLVRRTSEGILVLAPGLLPSGWRDGGPPGGEDREQVSARPLLPQPPPGEAVVAWLDDLTPVFVAREPAGDVHVIDATSPRIESELVGWCPSSTEFADLGGARWSLTGDHLAGPAAGELRRYPSEVVESGETAAVRVTGPLDARPPRSPSGERPEGPDCGAEDLIGHLPGQRAHVWDRGSVGAHTPGWAWVRMAIVEVDGRLLLCAANGQERCGEAVELPDPTNADCVDDIGPGGLCPPERDPVVVTDGIGPTDGPELMLVRGSADGRTVEVRRPVVLDGP